MSIAIDNMINAAIATIGVGETNGNNTNYITQWYGLNDAWCDMAVSYWAYKSGNVAAVGRDCYTVTHAQWFYNRGQWHTDVAGIQRGDIVFFDWNGSNSISAIDHVGIVESVSGADVHTIEGNIDNVCKRMVRHSDYIVGYGRPAYAVDPAGTTPPPTSPPPATNPPAGTYVVKAGDTLSVIAAANHCTLTQLLAVNPQITDPDSIDVGQVVNLPNAPADPPPPVVTPPPVTPTPVPPPPYCSLFNLLYAKSHGSGHKDDVLAFQKALARTVGLDYSSGPGIYGPLTTAACAKFQRSQGWPDNGTPTSDVLNLLATKTALFVPAP